MWLIFIGPDLLTRHLLSSGIDLPRSFLKRGVAGPSFLVELLLNACVPFLFWFGLLLLQNSRKEPLT